MPTRRSHTDIVVEVVPGSHVRLIGDNTVQICTVEPRPGEADGRQIGAPEFDTGQLSFG